MARTFNCGIGLVLIVDRQDDTTTLCDRLNSLGCTAQSIGSTVTHEPGWYHSEKLYNTVNPLLENPLMR